MVLPLHTRQLFSCWSTAEVPPDCEHGWYPKSRTFFLQSLVPTDRAMFDLRPIEQSSHALISGKYEPLSTRIALSDINSDQLVSTMTIGKYQSTSSINHYQALSPVLSPY